MGKKFQVSTIFKGIDQMSAPISRIQSRIGSMTRSVDRNLRKVQRTTGKVVDGMSNIAKKALIVGTIAAAGLGQAAAAGINFEQTIVNASAKMGESARRGTTSFKLLEGAAKRTGSTTEFTATQAAAAVNFLAMAGLNAEQSVAALPGVVDLATAAELDLAAATTIAADALGIFNLESKDSAQLAKNLARVNDVLAKTATSANTDISQMFEAMKKGGPMATTLGVEIETVAAMIGTMAAAGVKADIAGTAVANSFLNLSAPAGEALKVTRRLGLQFRDLATGELKDMPDILDELNKKTANLTKTQRLAALQAIFGREGLAGTSKVVSQGGEALRVYRERLRDANGSAADMAKTMRDTTRGSLNSLNSAIEGVSITLFETNRGPMRQAIDLATQWVRANGDVIAQNIGGFFLNVAKNIDTYVETGKKIATVVAIVWGLNAALKAVALATGLVNAAMALNPFVLLVGTFVALVSLSDTFAENLRKMPKLLQRAFNNSMIGTLAQGLQITKSLAPDINTSALFNMGKDAVSSAVVSPQDRTARTISESITSSTNEVIIRDETGRAAIQNIRGPQTLKVAETGGF
jgi:TP901 family phage tail tape measure protein